jgi:hypothetical protein
MPYAFPCYRLCFGAAFECLPQSNFADHTHTAGQSTTTRATTQLERVGGERDQHAR